MVLVRNHISVGNCEIFAGELLATCMDTFPKPIPLHIQHHYNTTQTHPLRGRSL